MFHRAPTVPDTVSGILRCLFISGVPFCWISMAIHSLPFNDRLIKSYESLSMYTSFSYYLLVNRSVRIEN